jgi:hypothetical protein
VRPKGRVVLFREACAVPRCDGFGVAVALEAVAVGAALALGCAVGATVTGLSVAGVEVGVGSSSSTVSSLPSFIEVPAVCARAASRMIGSAAQTSNTIIAGRNRAGKPI